MALTEHSYLRELPGWRPASACIPPRTKAGYQAVENVVSVHDAHATMLYLCGIDYQRLTLRFQGGDFQLTAVSGEVIRPILGQDVHGMDLSARV